MTVGELQLLLKAADPDAEVQIHYLNPSLPADGREDVLHVTDVAACYRDGPREVSLLTWPIFNGPWLAREEEPWTSTSR